MLNQCQLFLFLTSSLAPPSSNGKRTLVGSFANTKSSDAKKERVVGCVIAQPIKWGMKIVEKQDLSNEHQESDESGSLKRKRDDMVIVRSESAVDGDGDGGSVLC